MRYRFLQTGDIHVGRGRSSWGEDLSLDRSKRLFKAIFDVAEEHECDSVLITGDVFDRKGVTNREREIVSRSLALGASKDMDIYVIPGNHDLVTKDKSNLDYLAEITENTSEIPNLHVSFATHYSKWLVTKVDDDVKPLYIVGAPGSLSEYQDSLESVVDDLTGGQFVFMGHGTIKSCVRNDANWKPSEEEDSGITLSKVGKRSDIIWWAYGDIHKRQELPTLPRGANGWYAGSPIQMDFGETPDRGVLVVTLTTDSNGTWSVDEVEYVRVDDAGFSPLVTVKSESDIEDLPKDALIRLSKGLVLPKDRHSQIVSEIRVVDDRSTPEIAVQAASVAEDGSVSLETMDPLLSSIGDVEAEVLSDLQTTKDGMQEAKHIVGLAVDRFRNRTYVA